MDCLPGNPNLVDALRLARDLGCAVTYRHGTGEVRVRHPSRVRGLLLNSRRKDSPRVLTTLLRQLMHGAQTQLLENE